MIATYDLKYAEPGRRIARYALEVSVQEDLSKASLQRHEERNRPEERQHKKAQGNEEHCIAETELLLRRLHQGNPRNAGYDPRYQKWYGRLIVVECNEYGQQGNESAQEEKYPEIPVDVPDVHYKELGFRA